MGGVSSIEYVAPTHDVSVVGLQDRGVMSRERQVGKAGEYLVCYDLTMQGLDVFLASRNHAYDIVADTGSRLLRVQVRTCSAVRDFGCQRYIYRFSTRTARHGTRKADPTVFDLYALVALDVQKIAYLPPSEVLTRKGEVKQTIDMRSKVWPVPRRVYSNGTRISVEWGRFFEDYSMVPIP